MPGGGCVGGGGLLPQNLGGGVRPTPRNPYHPISDLTQNSIPFFRPARNWFGLRRHVKRASSFRY